MNFSRHKSDSNMAAQLVLEIHQKRFLSPCYFHFTLHLNKHNVCSARYYLGQWLRHKCLDTDVSIKLLTCQIHKCKKQANKHSTVLIVQWEGFSDFLLPFSQLTKN